MHSNEEQIGNKWARFSLPGIKEIIPFSAGYCWSSWEAWRHQAETLMGVSVAGTVVHHPADNLPLALSSLASSCGRIRSPWERLHLKWNKWNVTLETVTGSWKQTWSRLTDKGRPLRPWDAQGSRPSLKAMVRISWHLFISHHEITSWPPWWEAWTKTGNGKSRQPEFQSHLPCVNNPGGRKIH